MDKNEGQKLWEEVKANLAKINACEGPHDFVPEQPERKLGGRWTCSKCGGSVDRVSALWYRKGLADGGKREPRDV